MVPIYETLVRMPFKEMECHLVCGYFMVWDLEEDKKPQSNFKIKLTATKLQTLKWQCEGFLFFYCKLIFFCGKPRMALKTKFNNRNVEIKQLFIYRVK